MHGRLVAVVLAWIVLIAAGVAFGIVIAVRGDSDEPREAARRMSDGELAAPATSTPTTEERFRGAGRCRNEFDIVIPCALWLSDGEWTLGALAQAESTDRMLIDRLKDEPMNEAHFHLAQMIANQGGDLTEVIEQLTFAMEDARCESGIDPVQCAKYVLARAHTYYVRGAEGDLDRAKADLRAVMAVEGFRDEAGRSLAAIESEQAGSD